ncbi:tetratricopeptide repeat protein [Streptomyces sp. NPDC056948]|uniref:tetratricopeptide repeat protein n=1 Tax=Streptomyces sp. NPDC056948 TaxID=3345975 RepID=UPI00363E2886
MIGLLMWAGEDHPAWNESAWDWAWGWVQGIAGWVAQICGGLGRVFDQSGGLSLAERFGFFAAILLLLYFYWRATRAWLAFKPGPVDVQQLIDSTPPLGTNKPSIEDLTAEFRRQLSESSMYAPTTLPAEAPPMSFLELLGDVEIDPKKLGAILPRLLSRLRPKLAYRVSGVLRHRDEGPEHYGMTVTVMAFVFGGSRALTVWGKDWDEVIRKAGHCVISSLLPVTRAGRQPPWRKWWGRELNPALYASYQRANQFSRAGHYHEALEQYYEAIKLDPVNPYLRAELAEVQEKMGLHIDALDTCQRALTLDGQTAHEYNKRLWQSGGNLHSRRFRYLRHPRKYRDVLGLRYRNTIILGISEKIAQQWYERSGANCKDTHKDLIPILVDRYWPVAIELADIDPLHQEQAEHLDNEEKAREWIEAALSRKRPPDSKDRDTPDINLSRIRLTFQKAATQETDRLAADDLWARMAGLYAPEWVWIFMRLFWPFSYAQSARVPLQPVTRGAFQVNRKVWAPLRLTWATECFDNCRLSRKRTNATELRKQINTARGRIPLRPTWRRRDWLTLYNSACVYAVAMMKEATTKKLSDQLARCAVTTLEKAVLVSKGKFASVEQAWLINEDPDLALLQRHRYFKRFRDTAYPSPDVSKKPVPSNIEQMRAYDYRLLEETAKVMQKVWLRRSEEEGFDIHEATEWLRVERDIWKRIHEVAAADHRWRWRYRVDLIRSVQGNSDPILCGTAGFPPSVLADEPPDGHPTCEEIEELLRNVMRNTEGSRAPDSRSLKWQQFFSQATATRETSLSPTTSRYLSSGYAATWQTFRDWLAGEPKDQEGEQSFLAAVERLPEPERRPSAGPARRPGRAPWKGIPIAASRKPSRPR